MKRLVSISAAMVFASVGTAHAQQGISVSPMPFTDGAALPIAPAVVARPGLPAAAPAAPAYELKTGEPIHLGMKAWAEREGWLLVWHPTISWKTLRGAKVDAVDISAAVSEVVDILRDEGKPVALRISGGNKVMEVMTTEVRND